MIFQAGKSKDNSKSPERSSTHDSVEYSRGSPVDSETITLDDSSLAQRSNLGISTGSTLKMTTKSHSRKELNLYLLFSRFPSSVFERDNNVRFLKKFEINIYPRILCDIIVPATLPNML